MKQKENESVYVSIDPLLYQLLKGTKPLIGK